MKKWLSNLPMSKIMFTGNIAAGIAWITYVFFVGLDLFLSSSFISIFRTIALIIAICLEAFRIFAIWPKDKWDEMAEKNYTKARSETLGHIKTYIMFSLVAVVIEALVEYKFLFKLHDFMKLLIITFIIILIGEFGFVDLTTGLYFRKFEKDPDDETEDE